MSKHVLLIEDEPNITEAIRFILTRDGWTVTSHADGSQALSVVRAAQPDILILDVMLPGRSGYDILRDLRADPETADLPVLLLTARGQVRDREIASEAGATCFMAKPFSNAEMIGALNAMLRSGPGSAAVARRHDHTGLGGV